MKDNIDSRNIGNRKFVLELRYDHKVSLADNKGALLEAIKALNIFTPYHWEMGMANITIRDSIEKKDARTTLMIDLNKINFSSNNISTVEKFYRDFDKICSTVKDILGELNIVRIGCRIMGTYKTGAKDFDTIFNAMKDGFPSKFYLEQYPATDLMFQLDYKNGKYKIGPVKAENDPFVELHFAESYRTRHYGFAIDTDNYLTNANGAINDKQLIQNIYILSLSVEKDLFANLSSL